MKHRFNIDFFEFSFLVEACIPPTPIARASFWQNVINQYYHELTPNERSRLFEWISKNGRFQRGIETNDVDCLLFKARYDPENQYSVCIKPKGKSLTWVDCFKFGDRYHVGKNTFVDSSEIIEARKIMPDCV
jgi:hypothetical protein